MYDEFAFAEAKVEVEELVVVVKVCWRRTFAGRELFPWPFTLEAATPKTTTATIMSLAGWVG